MSSTSRCSIGSSAARWSLDALGQVVFRLALTWIPADQPLFILVDDTLARKTGKGISLATMHHDPLLSTARKPFCSFGHVWAVLALWVPLPMGGARGFALPVLFRLYVGAKRRGSKDAPGRPRRGMRQEAAEQAHATRPRPTKLALARSIPNSTAFLITANGSTPGSSNCSRKPASRRARRYASAKSRKLDLGRARPANAWSSNSWPASFSRISSSWAPLLRISSPDELTWGPPKRG